MKEFQVNNFITLKLEDGKTNIYVDGDLFVQCKFLLLNIPVEQVGYLDEIESVDEAAENLSKKMEKRFSPWSQVEISDFEVPPEVEFWAHCSNLQVWSEHNYDTRLIHSNLAFPLLKRLTEVGDPIAKKVFKEEIAKRLESGYWPVVEFLMKERYTDYLSRKEFFQCILEDEKEIQFLLEIEKKNDIIFYLERELSGESNNFTVKNKHIVGLDIFNLDVSETLPSISNLKFLKRLLLSGKNLRTLPDTICTLEKLEVLDLTNNYLESLPKEFSNLKSLEVLQLYDNKFKEIPKVILELKNLKSLMVENNLKKVSKETLKKLKRKGVDI